MMALSFGYSNPVTGNVTATTDPRGLVTTVAYNAERRVTQTTSPAPLTCWQKTSYDAEPLWPAGGELHL